MEIARVQKMVGSLETEAARIDAALGSLTTALGNTSWAGPDREKFVADWQATYAPAMRKARDDLRSTAARVRTSIQAQVKASGT